MFEGSKILFLGSHPDDIELGCGALLHRLVGKSDVHCATLSNNQENPALKDVIAEHHKSMAVLKVPSANIHLGTFKTRMFHEDRQKILDHLLDLKKRIKPDVVFVHTKADVHQDHGIVTSEALRAFRAESMFGYEIIRSSHGFAPQVFVEVGQADVDAKLAALAQYHTYRDKYYFKPELTKATLLRHGALAECQYAEGFEALRIVSRA